MLYLFWAIILYSILIYLYLHHKTHMRLKLFLIDNVIVILASSLVLWLIPLPLLYKYIISVIIVPGVIYAGIQLRFWRSPKRKASTDPQDIVSPADGKVIYIRKITENSELVSIKRGKNSALMELREAGLSPLPCWHIGINMTPFDVHKNCSPITGSIKLSKHHDGVFLSLKNPSAVDENERHTYVIENDNLRVAVVQIASKRVRRIDSYVNQGDLIEKGKWLGMIRFGSQVDVFLPDNCDLLIHKGQQLFAVSSVIAKLKNKEDEDKS